MVSSTRWLSVWALFLCGCSLALHIGKAPPALPLIRADWQLSLLATGSIVSVYTLLVALSGALLGWSAGHLGHVRTAIVGVLLAGIGSHVGFHSSSLLVLLVGRSLEGLGWLTAAITLPALLGKLSTPRDRPVVMGLWSSFVPVGAGCMLLAAPLLQSMGGWRLSWWVAGSVSLLASLVVFAVCQRNSDVLGLQERHKNNEPLQPFRQVFSHSNCWIMAGCFLCFSMLFAAVVSFIPTLLTELELVTIEQASRFTAFVVLANVTGNLSAGWLLRAGVSVRVLLCVGALSGSVAASLVYADFSPFSVRFAGALAFSAISGVIPGTLFATASSLAWNPAATGVLVGLMLQGSGAGQFAGPMTLAAVVDWTGQWSAAAGLILLIGLIGFGLGRRLTIEP